MKSSSMWLVHTYMHFYTPHFCLFDIVLSKGKVHALANVNNTDHSQTKILSLVIINLTRSQRQIKRDYCNESHLSYDQFLDVFLGNNFGILDPILGSYKILVLKIYPENLIEIMKGIAKYQAQRIRRQRKLEQHWE